MSLTRVSLPSQLQRGAVNQRSHVWHKAAALIATFPAGSPVAQAAQAAHRHKIRRQLERLMTIAPWELNGQEYSTGESIEGTLLHVASAAGDLDIVERLVHLGAKVDEPNWLGQQPYDGERRPAGKKTCIRWPRHASHIAPRRPAVAQANNQLHIQLYLDESRTVNLTDIPYQYKRSMMQQQWRHRNALRRLEMEYVV